MCALCVREIEIEIYMKINLKFYSGLTTIASGAYEAPDSIYKLYIASSSVEIFFVGPATSLPPLTGNVSLCSVQLLSDLRHFLFLLRSLSDKLLHLSLGILHCLRGEGQFIMLNNDESIKSKSMN